MRRPKISARMHAQAMIDILVADVAEKIFVGGDAEGGWTAPPFDFKTAVGFDLGKIADRAGVGDNVAVAHDSAPTATGAS